MASITQRFLVLISTVSARKAWHNDLPFVSQKFRGEYFQKNWEGVCGTLLETLTLFQTKICDFPYPISDLIKNLIPYSRPEALEPGAWPERVTSCYGTYTVVGVNIKTEMVLLPNDEEVANSSKKNIPNSRLECTSHTLFQAIILYYYMRNFCNLIGWEQWYFSLIKHCFVTQNLGSAKCLKTIMI